MNAKERLEHEKDMIRLGMKSKPAIAKPVEWTADEILRDRSNDWLMGK